MLKAAIPISARHAAVINDVHIQNRRRVGDVHHLSGDVSHAILELNEGDSRVRRDKVAVIVGVAINVKQHNGTILTRSECSRAVAFGLEQSLLTDHTRHVTAVRAYGQVTVGGKFTGTLHGVIAQVSIEGQRLIALG